MSGNFLESGALFHSVNDLRHAERRVHWLLDNYGMELSTDQREALAGLEGHIREVTSLITKKD